ncbi:MAG: M23 family metallopeptidase, partial [Candidatus Cloacimonetes bacterium]|nr:M23 family metallopeptidase [Candidatus Cloacimonadota bacterium]
HLSKYGKFKVGDRVEQHDIVGYVGSTGRSTGNHLHYTIYHHDKPINPLQLKNVSGPPVPKTELADFKIYADSLNNLLFRSELSITDTVVTQDMIVEQIEDQKQETIISITLIKIFLLLVILLVIFRIFMLLKKTNQNKGWS